MKTPIAFAAALALLAGCSGAPTAPEAHVHAGEPHAGEPHACQPPDVAPDALSHTPHTAGRPEIRYYVIGDA